MKTPQLQDPPVTMDVLDRAIISELQRDGRIPLTELGSKLGVSHGTVRNRLERLLKEQVIQIVAVIDPAKAGFPTQVLLGIGAVLDRMLTIEKELARLSEVYFVSTVTGRLDFLVAAAFASDFQLRDFLARKLSKIEGIRATETFHIIHAAKRNWQWKIPATAGGSDET